MEEPYAPGARAILSSAVLEAKPGSHSTVRLRELEALGDREMSVVTGVSRGQVGPGILFGLLTMNFLMY